MDKTANDAPTIYLSVQDAARLWSVSDRAARNWIRRERLQLDKDDVDARKRVLTWEQVQEIARKHKRQLPAVPPAAGGSGGPDQRAANSLDSSLERRYFLMPFDGLGSLDSKSRDALQHALAQIVDERTEHLFLRLDRLNTKQAELHMELRRCMTELDQLRERQGVLERMTDAIRVLLAQILGLPLQARWTLQAVAETLSLPGDWLEAVIGMKAPAPHRQLIPSVEIGEHKRVERAGQEVARMRIETSQSSSATQDEAKQRPRVPDDVPPPLKGLASSFYPMIEETG